MSIPDGPLHILTVAVRLRRRVRTDCFVDSGRDEGTVMPFMAGKLVQEVA